MTMYSSKKMPMHLTERQREGFRPVLVDIDFRYDYSITERQHTSDHIADLVQMYLDQLSRLLVFKEGDSFPIYILEKPKINRVDSKQITKDGIHMIIGLNMDTALQKMLRARVLKEMPNVWDMPITNTWEEVLDEGISRGTTNWQLYGSCKPGNDVYALTYHTIITWDAENNDFTIKAKNPHEFNLTEQFTELTARTTTHKTFDISEDIKTEYEKFKTETSIKKASSKQRLNIVYRQSNHEHETDIQMSDIKDSDTLARVFENILESLKPNEQYIKEIHRYAQILPEKYYKPGSHLANRMVAFALKHTDERLFLSWIMLRTKASDFDYATIPDLYSKWQGFNKRPDGVTKQSIMYWAKQDAFEEYQKVKKATIDAYIEDTMNNAGDWDYAQVLYHLFKDKYVCTSIKNKTWYVFEKHCLRS
jgi:hypothetical protein